MKRLICILLLAVWLMGGCAASDTRQQASPQRTVKNIRMTFLTTLGSNIEGLPEVQDAVNAITIPEIGVEVELVPVPAQETTTVYPASIAKDIPMDLMLINNENILRYIDQKMLLPLNDLLDGEASNILQIAEDDSCLTDGAAVDDLIYGLRIPSIFTGLCGGLWISPQLLKEVSFHYEAEKVYSFEELDVLFSRLKEAYPDQYPLGQITGMYDFSTASFFLGIQSDDLSGTDPSVLRLDSDSTRLVNYYETDFYYEWLEYMRKWYLDGYIYPDSAITTATSIGLYQEGVLLSIALAGQPDLLSENDIGTEIVLMRLSPVRQNRLGNIGIFWTIPVTSREPEAAMAFLNMMYADERIINLLSWAYRDRIISWTSKIIQLYWRAAVL